MSDNYEAVRQAADIHGRSAAFDDSARVDAITILHGHGLWSLTQIAAISAAKMSHVTRAVSKSDRTGGRLNPDSLTLIVEEFELRSLGQTNDALTARIHEQGTSLLVLSRLLAVNVGSLRTQVARELRRRPQEQAA